MWKIEEIGIEAKFFRFVHKSQIDQKTKNPIPRNFEQTELSVNWDKYSTAEETKEWIGTHIKNNGDYKNPNNYFIVAIKYLDIKNNIPNQNIEHDPIFNKPTVGDNRAHSLIIGKKDAKARLKFIDICDWAISPFN